MYGSEKINRSFIPMAYAQDPKTFTFSRPSVQLFSMIVFLILFTGLAFVLYQPIRTVFFASPYLNGLILGVFGIGIISTFWQVLRLLRPIEWLEGFVQERLGHDFIKPPRLLSPLSAMFRETQTHRTVTPTTARSILDTTATRLDEGREISRYIIGLLIFLGLLGTFWGLSNTVPAVVDTIRALAPTEGENTLTLFTRLISGLEDQLSGMGTAFASSLLGLAGSLVVGFLELLAGRAQNRFYSEFENWLAAITHISLDGDSNSAGSADLARLILQNKEHFTRMEAVVGKQTELIDAQYKQTTFLEERVATLVALHEDFLKRLTTEEDMAGLDINSKRHIKSIDHQLHRLSEEIIAGRHDTMNDLRAEIRLLAGTLTASSTSDKV